MLSRFWTRFAFVLSALLVEPTQADTCYYPNGNQVTQEPVTKCPNSNVCCPKNWVCAASGLCFDPKEQIYGRYSCASKDGSGCPKFCLNEFGSAIGNQAVLQCPQNNLWCCDGNRFSMNCCSMSGTTFFPLGNNMVVDTAANTSSPAPIIVTSKIQAKPSTTSIGTSTPVPTTSATPISTTITPIPQTPDASQSNTLAPSSKKPVIIGLAIGMLVSVIGLITFIVVIRKTRSKQWSQQQQDVNNDDRSKAEEGTPLSTSPWISNEQPSLKSDRVFSRTQTNQSIHGSGTPELDEIPVSVVPGRLELHGNSSTFELPGESSKHELDAANTKSAPISPQPDGAKHSSEERLAKLPSQPLGITC